MAFFEIEIILRVYFIGAAICLFWFMIMALMVFEKWFYENSSQEGKMSIESLINNLKDMNPDNPQKVYFILSLFVSLFWPIMIPYIIYKSKFD